LIFPARIATLRAVAKTNDNYRAWLKAEFAERCERNPRYSLRGFARDLRVLPSRLSDILNAKQGMSGKVAREVSQRLGWSPTEAEQFVTLVESEHARSQTKRTLAQEKLEKFEHKTIDDEIFSVISDWYHLPLLELVMTDGFKPELKWIAKRLGISEITVEQAVRRLQSVGLLKCTRGKWEVTEKFPATTNGVPSSAIKKYHAQMLKKADQALYLQSVEEREFSSNCLAINPDDLPQMKEELKLFRRALEKKYKARSGKKQVYVMNTQLFSLTNAESI